MRLFLGAFVPAFLVNILIPTPILVKYVKLGVEPVQKPRITVLHAIRTQCSTLCAERALVRKISLVIQMLPSASVTPHVVLMNSMMIFVPLSVTVQGASTIIVIASKEQINVRPVMKLNALHVYMKIRRHLYACTLVYSLRLIKQHLILYDLQCQTWNCRRDYFH